MSDASIPDDPALHAQALATERVLRAAGALLATAESCTGGWIAKVLTEIPGSSEWFVGGVVSYSNHLKQKLLAVGSATLERHGAVSGECAREMVAGAITHLDATIAVAVTGVAGPDGGSPEKPVGTVWIAWQQRGGDPRAECFRFTGDRDAVRRQTVAAALDGIRKTLTG